MSDISEYKTSYRRYFPSFPAPSLQAFTFCIFHEYCCYFYNSFYGFRDILQQMQYFQEVRKQCYATTHLYQGPNCYDLFFGICFFDRRIMKKLNVYKYKDIIRYSLIVQLFLKYILYISNITLCFSFYIKCFPLKSINHSVARDYVILVLSNAFVSLSFGLRCEENPSLHFSLSFSYTSSQVIL